MGEGALQEKRAELQDSKGSLVGGTEFVWGNRRKGVSHLPSAYIVPGTGLGALYGLSFHLQEPPVK